MGTNRLVRWDQRAREGVVQDALSSPSVVGYAGGKDYARNTNFSCMATSGACRPISPFRRIRFFHDKYRPMMRPPARLSSREHARVAVSVAAAAAGSGTTAASWCGGVVAVCCDCWEGRVLGSRRCPEVRLAAA